MADVIYQKYRSGANAPPSPWDTQNDCEALALKLTYPRKLNECTELTDACKALTEDWLNEAVRAKKDCPRKK